MAHFHPAHPHVHPYVLQVTYLNARYALASAVGLFFCDGKVRTQVKAGTWGKWQLEIREPKPGGVWPIAVWFKSVWSSLTGSVSPANYWLFEYTPSTRRFVTVTGSLAGSFGKEEATGVIAKDKNTNYFAPFSDEELRRPDTSPDWLSS